MAGQFDSVIGIHGFDEFVNAVDKVLGSRERAGAADQPIARAGPAAHRPGLRRRHVRRRPGHRPQRPPGRHGRAGRPGAAGERRGRRRPLPARPRRHASSSSTPTTAPARAGPPPGAHASSRATWPRPSAARRTSSGPSRTTATCGCCSPARSPPRSGACPAARCTGRARWPRRSPSRSPSWSATCGCRRCARPSREAVLLAGAATEKDLATTEVVVAVEGHVAIDLRLAGEIIPQRTIGSRLNPVPAFRQAAQGLEGRPAAVGDARPGRAPARPGRRRPRAGARAVRPHQPPAPRPPPPQPDRAPRPARPRDPHGDAHRHRAQPHDRGVGGPAGAGRGPGGRAERPGDPLRQPGGAGPHAAPGGARAPSCPPRPAR